MTRNLSEYRRTKACTGKALKGDLCSLTNLSESGKSQLPHQDKANKCSVTVRSTIISRVEISERPKIADEKTEIDHI